MSEIVNLREEIKQKLNQISDKRQLKMIQRMLNRLDELEDYIRMDGITPRNKKQAAFFRNAIDSEALPDEPDAKQKSLKSLVEKALGIMETLEAQVP